VQPAIRLQNGQHTRIVKSILRIVPSLTVTGSSTIKLATRIQGTHFLSCFLSRIRACTLNPANFKRRWYAWRKRRANLAIGVEIFQSWISSKPTR